MLIREASFAAIDFESAGVTRGSTDAPVQIGLALLEQHEQTWQLRPEWSFRSFLHSDQKIVWSAQKVHGIRTEDLTDAPRLLSLWPRLNATLRHRVVVAHGAGTEKRFLRAFPMHGFAPWVDTLKVAQAAFPHQPDYSLEALSQMLGVVEATQAHCPNSTFHDALFDAVASLLVLREILLRADLSNAPILDLLVPERSAYFAQRKR
jgi:DNA polymerase-3 subunit epsilon